MTERQLPPLHSADVLNAALDIESQQAYSICLNIEKQTHDPDVLRHLRVVAGLLMHAPQRARSYVAESVAKCSADSAKICRLGEFFQTYFIRLCTFSLSYLHALRV